MLTPHSNVPYLTSFMTHLIITFLAAPLYDQNWGGEGVIGFSVDGCVKNWIAGGGAPSAINIGLVSNISTCVVLTGYVDISRS